MTKHSRYAVISVLAASLGLGLAACKPIDKDAKTDAKPVADNKAADNDIAKASGLKTEREQASYMIGMDIGRTLKPLKDEVDLDVVVKAAKTMMDDGKPLLTDEQAMQIAQQFGQRIQEKKMKEMEEASKKNVAEGEKFLAENAKKPNVKTTASGLQYQVLTEGTGPKPKATDMVKVHYKGELLDGTKFDSSYDRKEPAVFSLEQVVPGWSEGVQLMNVGSKYKMWVPSKLGYGEQGTPGGPIAPNSTLVFEVELLEIVKPEDANNTADAIKQAMEAAAAGKQ